MKQHITLEDLTQLTESQKQRLTEIWTPATFDLAVAYVCTDITEEKYEAVPFAVGGIQLHKYGGMTLYDLRAMNDYTRQAEEDDSQSGNDTDLFEPRPIGSRDNVPLPHWENANLAIQNLEKPFSNPEEEESEGEECGDEDFEFDYEQPGAFNKEDCVPLLNIGQMIEILQRYNFGKYDFYLVANTYEIGCELGKTNTAWNNRQDWEPGELCDVLWESVKAILG